jgi:uncharacterized membrane protein YedE/YeeE
MTLAEVVAQTHFVLGAAFLLAVAFGAVAQRSHFCTMGAVADVVLMGDWSRARMWMLATAAAMAGFGLLSGLGLIDASRSLYTSPRVMWLSNLSGGLMFGVGMVLASGCGAKTLVRIGGGNLKSLVVFLAVGVAALATLRGITAVARVATVDTWLFTLPGGQDVPNVLAPFLGLSRSTLQMALGLGFGGLLAAGALFSRAGRRPEGVGAGALIGLLVAAMWWVSGHFGFVAEHPETLEAVYLGSAGGGMESFSFVAPMGATLDWLMMFSDRSKVLTFAVVLPFGVVLGSALMAWRMGQFRWEGFACAEDTANHLVGGLLMGVGGVTALGCTIGQGVSGLSTLAPGSALATAAMVGGAMLGLRYQGWRMGA